MVNIVHRFTSQMLKKTEITHFWHLDATLKIKYKCFWIIYSWIHIFTEMPFQKSPIWRKCKRLFFLECFTKILSKVQWIPAAFHYINSPVGSRAILSKLVLRTSYINFTSYFFESSVVTWQHLPFLKTFHTSLKNWKDGIQQCDALMWSKTRLHYRWDVFKFRRNS